MKTNLLKIGAFYKNNTPNGIGIYIENINYDLEETINHMMISYETAWQEADDKQRDKFVKGYINQLNHLAQLRTQNRSKEQNFVCIMNIWFLEKYGFIESDEFNGCQFIYGETS